MYALVSMRRRLTLLALAAILSALVLLHPIWLGAMGSFLVVRDTLQQSDAIVVLAGNSPYRVQQAGRLYADNWAPVVLVSNEVVLSHGVETTWLELWRRGLAHMPIPNEAIVPLEQPALSTYHEAVQSRDVMLARGWKQAILVTDPFHMRRAVTAFRGVWSPAGLTLLASPAEGSKYDVAGWWRDSNKATRVIQEYVKFPYYLLSGQL
ncbi:MAG: YdcF family protein [Chloroflexi bacterium]|nr:YdcF family protein [Chloroflexota bacterium]